MMRDPNAARLRLVFVDRRRTTMVVDAVVDTPAGAFAQAGRPVSIEVARPETPWFDIAMDHLLMRWADESRVVDARIAMSPRPHACLACDGSEIEMALVRLSPVAQA